MKLQIISLVLLFLISCTAKKGPSYSTLEQMENKNEYGVVYIIRENADPAAIPCTIKINGRRIVSLKQEGFTRFYVRQGPIRFKGLWSASYQERSKLDLDVEANQVYYIELTGTPRLVGGYGSTLAVGKGMYQISKDEAMYKLRTCCGFQKPKLNTVNN